MIRSTGAGSVPLQENQGGVKARTIASTILSAHGLEHLYSHSFPVLVTAIYADLGLNPFQAGIMSAVRQLTAGATSIGSGVLVDLFRHRSEQVLAGSMVLMGVGFFLVSISPVYGLILAALFIASIGNALWHPPALALLSQRFPKQRGLYISLHRASGSIGDLVGPLLAGALLGFVSWRWIIGGGTPLAVAMGLLVLVLLWKVAGSQPAVVSVRSNLRNQIASMRLAFHGTGMWAIFVVSAVRGMGDRSYIFFLPLYLKEGLDQSFMIAAIHVALVSAPGIISGPLFGALSDHIGRRPIIAALMAISVLLSVTTAISGGGIWMTVSVVLFGLFHSSVSSLTQAAAIDEVAGRGLDATFMGLMWGSNAFFGAAAAAVVGLLVGFWGWGTAFYCAAMLFFLGLIATMFMRGNNALRAQSA